MRRTPRSGTRKAKRDAKTGATSLLLPLTTFFHAGGHLVSLSFSISLSLFILSSSCLALMLTCSRKSIATSYMETEGVEDIARDRERENRQPFLNDGFLFFSFLPYISFSFASGFFSPPSSSASFSCFTSIYRSQSHLLPMSLYFSFRRKPWKRRRRCKKKSINRTTREEQEVGPGSKNDDIRGLLYWTALVQTRSFIENE